MRPLRLSGDICRKNGSGRARTGRRERLLSAAIFAMLLSGAAIVNGQEQYQASIADLRKEVALWQQKMRNIEGRITRTDAEIAGEVSSFRAFLRSGAGHKAQFQAQNDSLTQDISEIRNRVDSLELAAENCTMEALTADTRLEEIRLALCTACDRLKEFYETLPPGGIRAASTTLDFLRGELEANTVTASEAIERYWQMLGALDDAEISQDTYAAESPVAGLGSQAYYVRIGLAYLALVNEEGTLAYRWDGESGQGSGWKNIDDLAAATALRDAVRIRSRKIVPRIVNLPFEHPVVIRTFNEPDGDQRSIGK